MKSRYQVGDRVLFMPQGRVGIERGEYSAKVAAVKRSDRGGVSYRIPLADVPSPDNLQPLAGDSELLLEDLDREPGQLTAGPDAEGGQLPVGLRPDAA